MAKLIAENTIDPVGFRLAAVRRLRWPKTYRKVALVAAKSAEAHTSVTTTWNGEETTNIALPGDAIVTTLDLYGEPLRDDDGALNQYVIDTEKFAERYVPTGGANEHGRIYRSETEVEAFYLPDGFDIAAPWGERQQADEGYLLLSEGEVYGNAAETFEASYRLAG